jgi:hypothetical protein
VDPWGLAFSDILPGIKTAVVEGVKGGAYAVSEAAKATADIAANGDPLAKTALGVAATSVAAPVAGAVALSASPYVVLSTYKLAPYSPIIVDASYSFLTQGPPQPSLTGYLTFLAKEFIIDPLLNLMQNFDPTAPPSPVNDNSC